MIKPMSVQLEHKHRIENSSTPTCDQGNGSCNIDPSLQEPLFSVSSAVGRRWHSLRRRCYHWQRSQNFSFKVVSYNVLADGLLHANSHLYTGTEPWVQLWEYRKRNLLQEILHYDADVRTYIVHVVVKVKSLWLSGHYFNHSKKLTWFHLPLILFSSTWPWWKTFYMNVEADNLLLTIQTFLLFFVYVFTSVFYKIQLLVEKMKQKRDHRGSPQASCIQPKLSCSVPVCLLVPLEFIV